MAVTGPTPSAATATLRRLTTFNLAGLLILADQGAQIYVRRHVPALSSIPLADGVALVWQTITPGQPLTTSLWLSWVLIAGAVAAILTGLIRKQAATFSRWQVMAFGLLLGGTLSRFLDLLHWRHAVTYLWFQVSSNGHGVYTSLAYLSQWGGLLALGLHVLYARRQLRS